MPSTTRLYLVPTPIGNLEDMTLRAIRILKEADTVLTEDTRTSGKLLKHFGISANLQSYHAHNEHKKVEDLVNRMKRGETMALVTDAGTPGISDPGFLLVRACLQHEVDVECLPGPTALIPALVNSGLPIDRFVFEGFLPLKKGRRKRLAELALETRTMVLYESPHRLLKTLKQLHEVLGARPVAVSRELTKLHEETVRGTFEEVISYFEQKSIKGEFVLVIGA
ncbi:MAG: 16S rRNA (cytidine(1402)-2'-O)-methyltransferase [Cyclobacteriaceae bacterium]|nr:16S rRNA (cytidine(1402)-2'-O)-methyltransferase [Cyclobacteriaceae bacterium]